MVKEAQSIYVQIKNRRIAKIWYLGTRVIHELVNFQIFGDNLGEDWVI